MSRLQDRWLVRYSCAALLLALSALSLVMPEPARAVSSYPLSASDSQIAGALEFLRDAQTSDGSVGGFAVSAWVVMALSAAGEDPSEWSTSTTSDSIVDYLREEATPSSFEATDWARMILAIVAAGEDPTDFGGEDYVAGLVETYEEEDVTGEAYMQIGDPVLLNDDIWGILALVAAEENVNQDVVDFVQELQNSDGGWGIDVFSASDVDVTAAAIMALKAVGLSSGSTSVAQGLAFLRAVQNDDGGFPSPVGGPSNAASDSWAILAIVAAGGDPNDSEWEQSGGTPVDHLLSLQHTSGYFRWNSGSSSNQEWMTAYAIPALLGTPYPVPPLQLSDDNLIIARLPTSLAFRATEGGESPLARTFQMWNDGDGTMQYTVTDNKTWLYVSPSSGSSSGERDTITVEVNTDGMDAGEYQGTITITSSGASNSPRTVAVTLSVDEPTSDAEIAFWSEELLFTAIEGGSDPASQFIEIWNPGPGSMEWEVDVDDDWLNVSPSSGTSTGEHDKVTVSIDIDGLDAGDYEATITISSDDAENSPQEITVTLEVTGSTSTDVPEIGYSPSSLSFRATEGADDPDSALLKVWKVGVGKLDWVVSDNADWLSLSPTSGSSTGEKDEVDVSVDIFGLDAGQYTGRITIQDDDNSGNRKNVSVTLVVEKAEPEEEVATPEAYLLVATASPAGAGTISRNVAAGASGYASGTTVTLTATPSPGYAFVGWAGEAGGSAPTTTVVMSNHRSVVARFLRFDASGLTNVKLAYIPPELTALTVMPYPVASIPSSPPGFRINSAYVVQPEGSGTFALEFSELTNADSVALFQVVNGNWTQVPRTVMSDTSLQVTLPVADTVLTLATPGSSSGDLWRKFTGFFGTMDSTTMIIVAVIGVLALAVIAIIALLLRRDSY